MLCFVIHIVCLAQVGNVRAAANVCAAAKEDQNIKLRLWLRACLLFHSCSFALDLSPDVSGKRQSFLHSLVSHLLCHFIPMKPHSRITETPPEICRGDGRRHHSNKNEDAASPHRTHLTMRL